MKLYKCLSCHFKLQCKCVNLEHLFSIDLGIESNPFVLFTAFCCLLPSKLCCPSERLPGERWAEFLAGSQRSQICLLKYSLNTTCSFRPILKQASNFQVHEVSSGRDLACHLSLYHTNFCFWDQGWRDSSGSSGLW